MSSLFNQAQYPQANTTGGFLGNTSNFLNNPGSGLNNPSGYQNVCLGNFPQQQVLDSRSSVRQLTTLIPEWKGHFDLADVLMTSQEQHLNNVSMMVSQLYDLYSKFQSTFDYAKTSLNDINLQQDKLNEDLNERLRCQDLQNLVTIKSRRLCENVISTRGTNDMSSVFRIPNHINVQLSRELYERVRQFRSEVEYIQNEVQLLKEIDVFQAPNFIESVLNSHNVRIKTMGDMISSLLKKAEKTLNKDLKSHLWSGIAADFSVLRSDFLNAIGLDKPKPAESDSSQHSEVKKQIRYLRNFNSSYNDPNFPYLKDYGYNIKDLLLNFVPNQNLSLQGVNMGTNTGNLFGSSQFGTSNVTTPFGGTAGTTQPGGLFGNTQTLTTQPGGLFGSTQTGTTSSGLFGTTGLGTGVGLGTTTGISGTTGLGTGTGLFGSTTGLGTTTGTTGTAGSGLFGTTATQAGTSQPGGLFGSNTGTTTGTGLFGSTTGLGTTTGASATAGSGLFGSTTSTTGLGNTVGTGTGLFGSTTPATGSSQPGSLFGNTQSVTTQPGGLFGSTTGTTSSGLFGSSTGLGTTSGTTTGTGLFGNTNTSSAFGTSATTGTGLFGSTTTGTSFGNTNTGTGFGSGATSGLFGSTTTSSGFGTNTGTGFGTSGSSLFGSNQQKSTGTALAIYNPNPNTGLGTFNRT